MYSGKLRGSRHTFIMGAKIGSFVEVLGPYVQVDRGLKPSGILEKASRKHAVNVCLGSQSALLYTSSRAGGGE